MEERRETNGQRMMNREELEMRLPALNHIAEQRDAKFRLRYAEKTVNKGDRAWVHLGCRNKGVCKRLPERELGADARREAFRYPERSRWKILCDGRPGDDRGEAERPVQERRAVRENLSSCRIRKQYGKLYGGRYHIRSISRHADYISRRTDADECWNRNDSTSGQPS